MSPRCGLPRFALLLAASTALVACGNKGNASSPGPGDGGSGEDAAQDGGEEGSTSDTYPAFPVDYPQISKNQGAVLAAPVIVTVTWPDDTNASTWEAFGDGIGASSYWSATTAQYGVGAATSGASNHVRMTQPLASLSYYDLQNFVIATVQAAQGDGGAPDSGSPDAGSPNPAWPAPTKDAKGNVETIYSLFIPSSTSVTDPGSGMSFCTEGGLGYHDAVLVDGVPVPYAVNLECAGEPNSGVEETAAHECVEAATNPYSTTTNLGYVNFDTDHIAWDLYTGLLGNDELADACQNWQDSYFQETGSFPYWVQRSWSNESATGGHDPCAPGVTPYQGMTLFPSQESTVKLNLSSIGAGTVSTHGFPVTVGTPLTFQVGFFSDASTGPWKIAYDFPASTQLFSTSGTPIGNGKATVSIDKTSGQNGDKANVTVTVTAKGTAGFHVMAITWAPPTMQGFLPHYLPLVLVDQ